MGKRSRNKGKRGEREFAAKLREHGWDARRGVQYQGGNDSPDVACEELADCIHIEVKRCERLRLYDSVAQAVADAGEKVPIVVHRKNNGEWLVILRADDYLTQLREII